MFIMQKYIILNPKSSFYMFFLKKNKLEDRTAYTIVLRRTKNKDKLSKKILIILIVYICNINYICNHSFYLNV